MLSNSEILRRFGFDKSRLAGSVDEARSHADLAHAFIHFAEMLVHVLPDGRAKSVTLTELETTALWAHNSLAERSGYAGTTTTADLHREALNDE